MNENEFIEKMVDLMDTEEEITPASELADIEEWDSISVVSFLAMATKQNPAKKITPKEVGNAKTIHDLYVLMSD